MQQIHGTNELKKTACGFSYTEIIQYRCKQETRYANTFLKKIGTAKNKR